MRHRWHKRVQTGQKGGVCYAREERRGFKEKSDVTGRVRSVSLRSGQALCWPSVAEVPLRALKSAAALVLCLCAGGSEQLTHNE